MALDLGHPRPQRLGAVALEAEPARLRHAIPYVLSPDRAFDGIPGLERVDPTAALSVLA